MLLPRGWQMVHLVGLAQGEDLPDGILVLRPDNDIVNRPTWGASQQALDVVLGSGTDPAAADLATAAGIGYNATHDRAYFASRFARLDTDAVLRQRHAGHVILPMAANLDLGRHNLENVNALRAQTGQIPEITGACADPAGALCATTLTASAEVTVRGGATLGTLEATDVTITGDVTVTDWIRAVDVEITDTLTTPDLTACANPEGDLCRGGDLDLEAATGTPVWNEATIFGNVIIRDSNQLTGVTTTRAARGIFGEITGAPVLTVRGCFRSVTPFVYGARCAR